MVSGSLFADISNEGVAKYDLDTMVFSRMAAELPGNYDDGAYKAMTVSEINITGLPGITYRRL